MTSNLRLAELCNSLSKGEIKLQMKKSLKFKADSMNANQALEYLTRCEDVPQEIIVGLQNYITEKRSAAIEACMLASE